MNKSIIEAVPIIKEQLNRGITVTIETNGYSMIPLLHDGGDKTLLAKPEFPLKIGQVAFCKTSEGKYVLHRVIGVDGGKYLLKGDNCISSEVCLGDEDVVGVAIGFIRSGKTVDCQSHSYKLYVRYRQLFLKLWQISQKAIDWIAMKK